MIEFVELAAAVTGLVIAAWAAYKSPFVQGLFGRPTWFKVQQMANKIHRDISDSTFEPELIIGVGRGGAIAGSLISNFFGDRVIPVAVFSVNHGSAGEPMFEFSTPTNLPQRILIAEATYKTGDAATRLLDALKASGQEFEFRIACLVHQPDPKAKGKPDFVGEGKWSRNKAPLFPWMLHPTVFYERPLLN